MHEEHELARPVRAWLRDVPTLPSGDRERILGGVRTEVHVARRRPAITSAAWLVTAALIVMLGIGGLWLSLGVGPTRDPAIGAMLPSGNPSSTTPAGGSNAAPTATPAGTADPAIEPRLLCVGYTHWPSTFRNASEFVGRMDRGTVLVLDAGECAGMPAVTPHTSLAEYLEHRAELMGYLDGLPEPDRWPIRPNERALSAVSTGAHYYQEDLRQIMPRTCYGDLFAADWSVGSLLWTVSQGSPKEQAAAWLLLRTELLRAGRLLDRVTCGTPDIP